MLRCCSLSVLVGFVGLVGCGSVADHGQDAAGNCTGAACSPYGTGRDGDVSLISAVNLQAGSLGASSDANGEFPDGIAFKVVTAVAAGRQVRESRVVPFLDEPTLEEVARGNG